VNSCPTADVALHLDADDAEVTRRLLARAALEHRSDDTAEVIAQRLALCYQVTSPILCWYRDRGILVSVDAMRPAQQAGREILTALDAMRPVLDQGPRRNGTPRTWPPWGRRPAWPGSRAPGRRAAGVAEPR
jgi:hypothetical protein